MESEFRIIASERQRPLVILRGVVDGWNAPSAREAIRRASWPGDGVNVDVGGLRDIDGSGMHALVSEALDVRRAGGRLRLHQAGAALRARLLHQGLMDLIRVETALEPGAVRATATVRTVWKEHRLRVPADVRLLPRIRHAIVHFNQERGVDGELLDSLHLAAGEAVTNAIRHGSGDDPSLEVEVRCAATEDQTLVEIRDQGPGFDPARVPTPAADDLRPGGLGIHIMLATMDEVRFDFDHGGTIVRMVKRLPASCRGLTCREGGPAG